MREFKFKDNTISFTFGGEVFSAAFSRASTAMGEIGTLLQEAAENTQVMEDNVNKVLNIIDDLLGKGSIDKIFFGRDIDIVDVCDLVEFISEEVTEKGKKRAEALRTQAVNSDMRKFVSSKQN